VARVAWPCGVGGESVGQIQSGEKAPSVPGEWDRDWDLINRSPVPSHTHTGTSSLSHSLVPLVPLPLILVAWSYLPLVIGQPIAVVSSVGLLDGAGDDDALLHKRLYRIGEPLAGQPGHGS